MLGRQPGPGHPARQARILARHQRADTRGGIENVPVRELPDRAWPKAATFRRQGPHNQDGPSESGIGLRTVKAMFGESRALALRERDFAFDKARLWANVRVDLLGHPPEPKLALTVS